MRIRGRINLSTVSISEVKVHIYVYKMYMYNIATCKYAGLEKTLILLLHNTFLHSYASSIEKKGGKKKLKHISIYVYNTVFLEILSCLRWGPFYYGINQFGYTRRLHMFICITGGIKNPARKIFVLLFFSPKYTRCIHLILIYAKVNGRKTPVTLYFTLFCVVNKKKMLKLFIIGNLHSLQHFPTLVSEFFVNI